MAEEGDYPNWGELIPDALGLIFKNLSLCEMLTVVPCVCKSWKRAIMGPYCWLEIDIEEWSRNCQPEAIDRMIRLLVTRSCGSLRKLCVSGVSDEQTLLFVANNAPSLRILRLPRCEIHDPVMGSFAGMFTKITVLDLSYCINVGAYALEAIGKYCKSLTTLRRVMHPLEVIDKFSQNDEAFAIANTMPRLKHLEIAYLLVETTSIKEIIWKCKYLELLDVRGCWDVELDEGFVKRFPKLKVVGPLVVDYHDRGAWDNCSDYSGSSGYLAWDFVAGDLDLDDELEDYPDLMEELWREERRLDDVEMFFYDDFNAVDAGSDWPQSP